MTCHSGPCGEAPGLVRSRRSKGESMGTSFHCGFHGKEWVMQGEQG